MDSENISSPSRKSTLNDLNSFTPEITSKSNNNSNQKEIKKLNLNQYFIKEHRQFDTKDTAKAKRKIIIKEKNLLYNNKIFNEIKLEINNPEINNYLLFEGITYGKMLEHNKYEKLTKEMLLLLYDCDIQVDIDFIFITEWEKQKEIEKKQNRDRDKVSELVGDMISYLSELFKDFCPIPNKDNVTQINKETITNQNEDNFKKVNIYQIL